MGVFHSKVAALKPNRGVLFFPSPKEMKQPTGKFSPVTSSRADISQIILPYTFLLVMRPMWFTQSY